MKISIIVPVYNVEKYLEKCIESILRQTMQDFEIILINDGSSDSSGSICDKYVEKDYRIKVIHQTNQGQGAARNAGLKIAIGDFIGFVDSDDWIEADMYSSLYIACEINKSEISIIGLREVNEKGLLKEYHPSDNMTLSEILKRAYPCNKLFKRELFTKNNFKFECGKYYEDLELIPKLFLQCTKVSVVSNISYNYLKRDGSTTQSRDEKILDNLWAYIQLNIYLEETGLYSEHREEFEKGLLYFKKYFINTIYDYPTLFFLKYTGTIIKDMNKIGGLNFKEYYRLAIRHTVVSFKRIGHSIISSS